MRWDLFTILRLNRLLKLAEVSQILSTVGGGGEVLGMGRLACWACCFVCVYHVQARGHPLRSKGPLGEVPPPPNCH